MLPRSGDIRDQSLKWSKLDRNFACFWPQNFLGEHRPNFWSQFIKYSQIPIMWQSFRAIGRGISQKAWRKKENVTGKTEARPELIVPGGLKSNGPRTLPCTTPLVNCCGLEKVDPTRIHWVLLFKNSPIHFSRLPQIPKRLTLWPLYWKFIVFLTHSNHKN